MNEPQVISVAVSGSFGKHFEQFSALIGNFQFNSLLSSLSPLNNLYFSVAVVGLK